MMNTNTQPKQRTARINGELIQLHTNETLLQGALRQGIDIPYSCRVGGCATCKCKLVDGKVRQLTETSYLLSDEELDNGTILACQSVPLTDVIVEVDLTSLRAQRHVSGRVIAQEPLTHDITRLRVQLDQGLSYRAGQFAEISLACLPNIRRSYSFAAPTNALSQVEFFIRKVPGGVFSSAINDQDLLGQAMLIEGPVGDFHLRDGQAPLFFVAGGSGLAPVMAILKDALAQNERRPVTVLFGARTIHDLYGMSELNDIAAHWPSAFKIVPILSAGTEDTSWTGRCGLVTEHIPELLPNGAHTYLCGPPVMIDAAAAMLLELGISREHLYADRFTSRHENTQGQEPFTPQVVPAEATTQRAVLAAPARSTEAGLFDYLKFMLFHLVGLSVTVGLVAGGVWTQITLAGVILFYIVGDGLLGEDTSTPHFKYPGILTFQLWLALPLIMLITFAGVWTVSGGDPLGFGAWVNGWSGYDVLSTRAQAGWGHHISAAILTILMIGVIGTITAHELTHRTWDAVSLFIGRWLLAFSFDTSFAIEHVYGHHRYVSTEDDPATAPRGRNVYAHVAISTIKGNVSAWNIEARSLRRRGLPVFSWRNAVIRGYLMSLTIVLAFAALGGWAAAGFFIISGIFGKSLLEIVNYMEHYGIVRNPVTPVQPRHSWNTTCRISSWSMFNLTRHSHHHAQGEVPFHELQPFQDAPKMISGYLSTLVLTLIPPLWHRLMAPKLQDWDQNRANEEEKLLAMHANARSGLLSYSWL